jgi:hypothetical protein
MHQITIVPFHFINKYHDYTVCKLIIDHIMPGSGKVGYYETIRYAGEYFAHDRFVSQTG